MLCIGRHFLNQIRAGFQPGQIDLAVRIGLLAAKGNSVAKNLKCDTGQPLIALLVKLDDFELQFRVILHFNRNNALSGRHFVRIDVLRYDFIRLQIALWSLLFLERVRSFDQLRNRKRAVFLRLVISDSLIVPAYFDDGTLKGFTGHRITLYEQN